MSQLSKNWLSELATHKPQCYHGNNLKDGAGQRLEPDCGCRHSLCGVKSGARNFFGRDPVNPEFFGKDHWSTFAYVESRWVDYKGILDTRHMRCDPDRHSDLFVYNALPTVGKKYPTMLSDGLLPDHDDWDCLDDLQACGLIVTIITSDKAHCMLTLLGEQVAASLRTFKAHGDNFRDFRWKP